MSSHCSCWLAEWTVSALRGWAGCSCRAKQPCARSQSGAARCELATLQPMVSAGQISANTACTHCALLLAIQLCVADLWSPQSLDNLRFQGTPFGQAHLHVLPAPSALLVALSLPAIHARLASGECGQRLSFDPSGPCGVRLPASAKQSRWPR